ncbi:unnamed protein product [Prunus armeniaca]
MLHRYTTFWGYASIGYDIDTPRGIWSRYGLDTAPIRLGTEHTPNKREEEEEGPSCRSHPTLPQLKVSSSQLKVSSSQLKIEMKWWIMGESEDLQHVCEDLGKR